VVSPADEVNVVLVALGLDDAGRVSVHIDERARAWADAARLRQILRNLVTNAVRYGGPDIGLEVGSSSDSSS
jgi:signal transduction histidine kinase